MSIQLYNSIPTRFLHNSNNITPDLETDFIIWLKGTTFSEISKIEFSKFHSFLPNQWQNLVHAIFTTNQRNNTNIPSHPNNKPTQSQHKNTTRPETFLLHTCASILAYCKYIRLNTNCQYHYISNQLTNPHSELNGTLISKLLGIRNALGHPFSATQLANKLRSLNRNLGQSLPEVNIICEELIILAQLILSTINTICNTTFSNDFEDITNTTNNTNPHPTHPSIQLTSKVFTQLIESPTTLITTLLQHNFLFHYKNRTKSKRITNKNTTTQIKTFKQYTNTNHHNKNKNKNKTNSNINNIRKHNTTQCYNTTHNYHGNNNININNNNNNNHHYTTNTTIKDIRYKRQNALNTFLSNPAD